MFHNQQPLFDTSSLHTGTGSVGLEAISRGASEAHFIELDPWVIRNVLQPNVVSCRAEQRVSVVGGKAESFLERSTAVPEMAPAAFDFIR